MPDLLTAGSTGRIITKASEDMNKNEYAIWVDNDRTTIVDVDGQEIGIDEAWSIIHSLQQTYPEKCYVYLGQSRKDRRWKIGMSHDVARRASELSINIVHQIECDNAQKARDLEVFMFSVCLESRDEGEWFLLTDEQIDFIKAFDKDSEIDNAIEALDRVTCYIFEHIGTVNPDDAFALLKTDFPYEIIGLRKTWVVLFLEHTADLILYLGKNPKKLNKLVDDDND